MTKKESEQGNNLLTWMVLGTLLLQVILSAGLLWRINQVYQVIMGSPSNPYGGYINPISAISSDDDPFWGSENAPVTIVEFSDFSCGACKSVQPTLEAIYEKYSEQVRIVFRDFPGGGPATPGYSAALAAECAEDQGKYWEMREILFENSPVFDQGSLRGYASQIDLDIEQFETCMDSDATRAEVDGDLLDGRTYGVAGTPTFYVNGYQILGAESFDTFQREIKKQLP